MTTTNAPKINATTSEKFILKNLLYIVIVGPAKHNNITKERTSAVSHVI
jgi:hypothetical protein